MTPDDRSHRTAARQRGHITRSQALECGLTERQIDQRAANGWARILPGVYRMPGVPDSFEGRLTAVKLWMGDDGHFCGPSAGRLLRLEGVDKPALVTVSRYQGFKTPPWLKVVRLNPDDRPRLRNIAGFRVPVTERVLLELAGALPPRAAGMALDDALRRKMTTLDRLNKVLAANGGRGRSGTTILRKMVKGRDHRDARVRSLFETKMLRILKRIEGLEIVPDRRISAAGHIYYLDFYLPSGRLGIECQSIRWHMGDEWLDKDVKRHRRISGEGIEILYFTWDEVNFDASGVEREVREALARRCALPGI